jgi:hypothetical protein
MEHPQDTAMFLSLLTGPAFSVKDGLVDSLNANAQYLNILIGRGVVTMEEILELFEMYI